MAISKTSFGKDKQPAKRTPRGKSERTKILDAMKRQSRTEEEFYDSLVERASNPEDTFAFKELLSRISPIPKQVAPFVEFKINKDGKPHEKASDILDGIADGDIPPDVGTHLIVAIKNFVDLDNSDIKERVEKIEAMLNGK